ncbi:hypothetical protein KXV51_003593 [Aspergillus fumigatus]|nr:hypothetical protein KXX07_001498 [Aspergillus fumigatus]KAH2676549.1 hypothetical protein KXV51_003593 [Aspergillus fumigatus]OXN11201.1 hypothetical protein CDV58_00092 [Aspergillus fumigatus]
MAVLAPQKEEKCPQMRAVLLVWHAWDFGAAPNCRFRDGDSCFQSEQGGLDGGDHSAKHRTLASVVGGEPCPVAKKADKLDEAAPETQIILSLVCAVVGETMNISACKRIGSAVFVITFAFVIGLVLWIAIAYRTVLPRIGHHGVMLVLATLPFLVVRIAYFLLSE